MAKEGRFCDKVDEQTGEVCNTLMQEGTAIFRCPKCGHAYVLTVEEMNEKIAREGRKNRPGQLHVLRHAFATEEGDVIGQA